MLGVRARAGALRRHRHLPRFLPGLRELGVKAQPRKLLATVEGLTLTEMNENEVCCGFGGTFCIKYPDISNRMVTEKVANIRASGAARCSPAILAA